MMKKIFSLLAALALCLSLLPCAALASDEVKELDELDLTAWDVDSGDLKNKGYAWDDDTLTLENINISGILTLPSGKVEIITKGTCSIGGIQFNKSSATQLTISGDGGGTLTINGSQTGDIPVPIGIQNGGEDGETLTVKEGATVTVNAFISLGSSGGVNSTITVDGSLTVSVAQENNMYAISAGKVEVGNTGFLEISSTSAGIWVSGNDTILGNFDTRNWEGAFKLTGNGRFIATCFGDAIRVIGSPVDKAPEYYISLPNKDYLPVGRKIESSENVVYIAGGTPFTISEENTITYPVTVTCGKGGTVAVSSGEGAEDTASADSSGSILVRKDDTITLEATPSPLYKFVRWEVIDGGVTIDEDDEEGTATFTMSTEDVRVDAVWEYTHGTPNGTPHDWAEEWKSNGTYHWHKCEVDGCELTDISEMGGYGEHDYTGDQCNTCEYERTHEHVWATEWSSDASHHWHVCESCEEVADKAEHTWNEGVVTTEPTDDAAGEKTYTCSVCGYAKTEPILPHVWSEAWSSDNLYHWHACMIEGCELIPSEMDGYAEHVYDSTSDAECNICRYVRIVWRPSKSSSSVSTHTYAITADKAEHGKVTVSRTAESGSTVSLTAVPDSGYMLDTLKVTDSNGNEIRLTRLDDNRYSFTMPGRTVTIKASFVPVSDDSTAQLCDGGAGCPSRPYPDLNTSAWYHEATDYAIREGLLAGYGDGTFRPDGLLSRAMLAQILYNREGRPGVSSDSSFIDVASDAWYRSAVAWAKERSIVSGYGDGRLGPDESITREQFVAMLWQYMGRPEASDTELHFSDADQANDYALDDLLWAVENGVINGYGSGQLEPTGFVTRAQAAQMLMNLFQQPE